MSLDFITWTPITYYAVVGFFQFVAFVLVGLAFGIRWDIQGVVGALLGCAALSLLSFVTREWELGALLLFWVAAFITTGMVTKGEALPSFISTVAMTIVFFISAHFLVAPHTPLSIRSVGGASYFMRYYRHYKLPFDQRDYNEKDPSKLIQKGVK